MKYGDSKDHKVINIIEFRRIIEQLNNNKNKQHKKVVQSRVTEIQKKKKNQPQKQ